MIMNYLGIVCMVCFINLVLSKDLSAVNNYSGKKSKTTTVNNWILNIYLAQSVSVNSLFF